MQIKAEQRKYNSTKWINDNNNNNNQIMTLTKIDVVYYNTITKNGSSLGWCNPENFLVIWKWKIINTLYANFSKINTSAILWPGKNMQNPYKEYFNWTRRSEFRQSSYYTFSKTDAENKRHCVRFNVHPNERSMIEIGWRIEKLWPSQFRSLFCPKSVPICVYLLSRWFQIIFLP